jgi:hypothetical protein
VLTEYSFEILHTVYLTWLAARDYADS